jgi:hypothetical protein
MPYCACFSTATSRGLKLVVGWFRKGVRWKEVSAERFPGV